MRFIWPLDNHYITRGFDYKSSIYIGGQHAAADLVHLQGDTKGRPIKASADGTVVGDDFNSISGYYIVIEHADGWRTTYRHLVTDAPPAIGDRIVQGQVIGNVGSTGWSTGPHLHFDLWHIDKQDPTAFSKVGWWAHNPELYLGIETTEPAPEPPLEPVEEEDTVKLIKGPTKKETYTYNGMTKRLLKGENLADHQKLFGEVEVVSAGTIQSIPDAGVSAPGSGLTAEEAVEASQEAARRGTG